MDQDRIITQLKSRITVLEQLLNEYEQATIIQSERLEDALNIQRKQIEELNLKNEELEKFNKIAVDRELKMVELKKRIKELEGIK